MLDHRERPRSGRKRRSDHRSLVLRALPRGNATRRAYSDDELEATLWPPPQPSANSHSERLRSASDFEASDTKQGLRRVARIADAFKLDIYNDEGADDAQTSEPKSET